MKTKKTLPIIALLIVFVVYNIIVFSFSGLIGFTTAFWTSYAVVMLFFVTLLVVLIVLGQTGMSRRDWFFGIPIIKHTFVYGALTVVCAIVFLALGNAMHIAIPISIAAVIWTVYMVMILSCLYIKENSDSIMATNTVKSEFIKDLRSRADYICKQIDDPAVKDEFLKLKELTESSMPYTYTGKDLSEIEKQILDKMTTCETLVNSRDYVAAKSVCLDTIQLLEKRNLL